MKNKKYIFLLFAAFFLSSYANKLILKEQPDDWSQVIEKCQFNNIFNFIENNQTVIAKYDMYGYNFLLTLLKKQCLNTKNIRALTNSKYKKIGIDFDCATERCKTTALMMLMSLPKISTDLIQSIIFQYKLDINKKNSEGNSALMIALEENNIAGCKALIEYDDINVNIINIYGKTPLHLVKSKTALDLLIKRDAIIKKDKFGYYPLDYMNSLNNPFKKSLHYLLILYGCPISTQIINKYLNQYKVTQKKQSVWSEIVSFLQEMVLFEELITDEKTSTNDIIWFINKSSHKTDLLRRLVLTKQNQILSSLTANEIGNDKIIILLLNDALTYNKPSVVPILIEKLNLEKTPLIRYLSIINKPQDFIQRLFIYYHELNTSEQSTGLWYKKIFNTPYINSSDFINGFMEGIDTLHEKNKNLEKGSEDYDNL